MNMDMNIDCPVCGADVWLLLRLCGGLDRVHLFEPHPAAQEHAGVSGVCFVSGMLLDDALAVARIQDEEGDRLRLAAHP